jgi:ankyrin repeat protein
MLQMLIDNGLHTNQYDYNKRTPLWLAARNNQFECCAILLSYNGNPFLESKDGKKPIDVACDPAVRKLIKEKMNDLNDMESKSFFRLQIAKRLRDDIVANSKKK